MLFEVRIRIWEQTEFTVYFNFGAYFEIRASRRFLIYSSVTSIGSPLSNPSINKVSNLSRAILFCRSRTISRNSSLAEPYSPLSTSLSINSRIVSGNDIVIVAIQQFYASLLQFNKK